MLKGSDSFRQKCRRVDSPVKRSLAFDGSSDEINEGKNLFRN